MDCGTVREHMGLWLDGELPPELELALTGHLETCPACAAEFDSLRKVVSGLEHADLAGDAVAPAAVWDGIQDRLATRTVSAVPRIRRLHWLRRPLAAAASLGLLIGAAVFVATWLSPAGQVATATTVDYSVLLDPLPDVDRAVQRFLKHYDGRAIAPGLIPRVAPNLRLTTPAELPGGYRLEGTYSLQFGASTGIAAVYRRNNEPLFVFFHPPVNLEKLGVHRESHCDVAGRSGHCVEVGGWRLMHFTDPTTCHCLLSRIEDQQQVEAVLAAVSPGFNKP